MRMPLGAYGRHDLLQHSPPQIGRSPPVVPVPHACPAGVHPPTPVASATPQTPSVEPAALVQRPPQQSTSFAHESVFCLQYEGAAEQMLFLQNFEQQSPFAAHGLPDVLHVVLSGVHVVPPHFPPQQAPSVLHVAPSAVHCWPEHFPPTHANVQHSVFAVHAASGGEHSPADCAQRWDAGSQLFVQQSLPVAQPKPTILQAVDVVEPSPVPLSPCSSAPCSLPQPPRKWRGIATASTAIPQMSFVISILHFFWCVRNDGEFAAARVST
jgi:hypothetical protein